MIGGVNVDNDIVKNNDPIQLQQMIIFLRAELAKYKMKLKGSEIVIIIHLY